MSALERAFDELQAEAERISEQEQLEVREQMQFRGAVGYAANNLIDRSHRLEHLRVHAAATVAASLGVSSVEDLCEKTDKFAAFLLTGRYREAELAPLQSPDQPKPEGTPASMPTEPDAPFAEPFQGVFNRADANGFLNHAHLDKD